MPERAARRHPSEPRRRALKAAGALALVACVPAHAADDAWPAIPALTAWLAGRVPRRERVRLALPAIADNGFSVPLRIAVAGPFAPGPWVRSLRLFSEANPVPEMAAFAFPQPVERVEVETRVRLAATQHVVAVAEMTDGRLYAAATEVVVTLAGCMDGT